jgi:hypothetical protein
MYGCKGYIQCNRRGKYKRYVITIAKDYFVIICCLIFYKLLMLCMILYFLTCKLISILVTNCPGLFDPIALDVATSTASKVGEGSSRMGQVTWGKCKRAWVGVPKRGGLRPEHRCVGEVAVDSKNMQSWLNPFWGSCRERGPDRDEIFSYWC